MRWCAWTCQERGGGVRVADAALCGFMNSVAALRGEAAPEEGIMLAGSGGCGVVGVCHGQVCACGG